MKCNRFTFVFVLHVAVSLLSVSYRLASGYTIVSPDFSLSSCECNRDLVGDPERPHPPVPSCAYLSVQKLFAVQLLPVFLVLQIPRLDQVFPPVLIL